MGLCALSEVTPKSAYNTCCSTRLLQDGLVMHPLRRSSVHIGPDAFLMEALFRNEVWGHMQVPVSRVNEEAVCQSMMDGCR